jgi:hypothetical protein
MQLALMESCKDYERKRCHAPGRQQDRTTASAKLLVLQKKNLHFTTLMLYGDNVALIHFLFSV